MKKICILILFVSTIISAQKKEFKYSLSGITKVVLSSDTSLNLEVGTTQELIFSTPKKSHGHEDIHEDGHENDNEDAKEREDKRKGLTAIYPGGRDNTDGFGFSITKEGSTLYVTDLKSHFQRHGLNIKLPKNMNISVDSEELGSVKMDGFSGEIEVQTNVGFIKMNNVTGPITANTSVGKIDIDFSKVSQTSPITISSSVSEIDVALPANTKADLSLRTQGTVFTNFDFEIPTKKGLKNVSGRKSIDSKLNNGGVKIYIKSSMGNIYLRKK